MLERAIEAEQQGIAGTVLARRARTSSDSRFRSSSSPPSYGTRPEVDAHRDQPPFDEIAVPVVPVPVDGRQPVDEAAKPRDRRASGYLLDRAEDRRIVEGELQQRRESVRDHAEIDRRRRHPRVDAFDAGDSLPTADKHIPDLLRRNGLREQHRTGRDEGDHGRRHRLANPISHSMVGSADPDILCTIESYRLFFWNRSGYGEVSPPWSFTSETVFSNKIGE
jgi:hypothetical protein